MLDAIEKHIKEEIILNGGCLVMLPELSRTKRKHDELAALITSELKGKGIDAAVMHSSTTESAFSVINQDGNYHYKLRKNSENFYRSYLRNVALVKVLINNEKYPFRLKTPLYADLTIGIDVKHNTACYTFINKYADRIRQDWKDSDEKECLRSDQVRSMLISTVGELIAESAYDYPIKHIVIHRDGRFFESEKKGVDEALAILRLKGVESITVLEIQKSSPAPFRVFSKAPNDEIYNPSIGTYYCLNEQTAFLCSTGSEYPLRGTVNPLCVNYHSGALSFEDALEDLFYLTNLTFTKLDSCSRVPLSIKLTDLKLKSIASEYDSEKLEAIKVLENLGT